MDAIRYPFTAFYRMYPGEEPIEIRWFPAHSNAQYFTGITPFHAAGHYEHTCPLGPNDCGEVVPVRRRPSSYERPAWLTGEGAYDGTEEDFRGTLPRPAGALFDPPLCLYPPAITLEGDDQANADAEVVVEAGEVETVSGGEITLECRWGMEYITPDLGRIQLDAGERFLGDVVELGLGLVVEVATGGGIGGTLALGLVVEATDVDGITGVIVAGLAVEAAELSVVGGEIRLGLVAEVATGSGYGVEVALGLVVEATTGSGIVAAICAGMVVEVTTGSGYGVELPLGLVVEADDVDGITVEAILGLVVEVTTGDGMSGEIRLGLVVNASSGDGTGVELALGLVVEAEDEGESGTGVDVALGMVVEASAGDGIGVELALGLVVEAVDVHGIGVELPLGLVVEAEDVGAWGAELPLGLVVEAEEDDGTGGPGTVEPGPDCASAGVITTATEYGGTADGDEHWWRCPLAAGIWHLTWTIGAGSIFTAATLYSGSDCGDRTFEATANRFNLCVTLILGSDTNLFIQVQALFSGTGEYTFRIDSGPCG